jgi:hypothetical protein
MPKGESGRVVIEVDPNLKRRLYSALAIDNLTLKDWFVEAAKHYVAEKDQPSFQEIVKRDRKKIQQ